MSRWKDTHKQALFLAIAAWAAVAWSLYYALDYTSLIKILKLLLPVYIGIFILGQLIQRILRLKPNDIFMAGFWIGLLILAPFYMYQFSNLTYNQLVDIPVFISLPIKLVMGLIAALTTGTIAWIVQNLFQGIRRATISRRNLYMQAFVLFFCFLLLIPLIAENQAAQSEEVQKRTSYREFVEREPVTEPAHRVVLFGIDSADWNVMKPMLESGKLGNFRKLMESGRWGTLKSMEPTKSPVVWTTIFTSKTPEEHGISDWIVSKSENRLVKAVWNIASEYDLRSTIINIPGTYPPEEFQGTEISGFPFPNQTMNTYGWILGTKNLKINFTSFNLLNISSKSEGIVEGEIVVSDIISKQYTEFMESRNYRNLLCEHVIRDDMSRFYGGRIKVARFRYNLSTDKIEILSPETDATTIAVLGENEWSDFFPVNISPGLVGMTRINAITLDRENIVLYMTPFFQPSDHPAFQFTHPESLASELSDKYGQYVVETAWKGARDPITIPSVLDMLFDVERCKSEISRYLFDKDDWDLFIYVCCVVDRTQHLAWPFHAKDVQLSDFQNVENGEYIFNYASSAIEKSYEQADEYLGHFMNKVDPERDVILVLSDHGMKAGTGRQRMVGVHRDEGIYIISGGPVKPLNNSDYEENLSENRSILDVTSNILYIMGLPVGSDMKGEVWDVLFEKQYVDKHPVKTISTYDFAQTEGAYTAVIDESTLKQLEGLGYLED